MHRHFRLATKTLHLFVVVAILLTSVPAPMNVTARAARPASADGGAEPLVVDRTADESLGLVFQEPLETPTPEPLGSGALEPVTLSSVSEITESHQSGNITITGGSISSKDGHVRLDFAPDAVQTPTGVTIHVHSTDRGNWNGILLHFTIDAQDVQTNRAIDRLERSAALTLDMTGCPGWITPYLLRQTDKEQDQWEMVPSHYDPETQMLTAAVDTFATYAVESSSDYGEAPLHHLLTNLPDASIFSGAVTYAYPIEVPAGRNGLTPNLSLSYNSNGINGLRGAVQSSDVGLGWSLGGSMQIVRAIKTSRNDNGQIMWRYGSGFSFNMVINGSSHHLIGPDPQPDNGGCRYYAEDAPDMLVMRYTANGGDHDGDGQADLCGYGAQTVPGTGQESKEYWIVTDANGTTYRFGFTADAEQLTVMKPYDPEECYQLTMMCESGPNVADFYGYAGEAEKKVVYRWSVDQIQDVYGNKIEYGYYEHTVGYYVNSGLTINYDRAQHLNWIRYADHYLVDFDKEKRCKSNDWGESDCSGGIEWHDNGEGTDSSWAMWDIHRIDRIKVCTLASPGASECADDDRIAEYDLDYEFVEEPHPGLDFLLNTIPLETTRLYTITRYGKDAQGNMQALPVTTFEYCSETNSIGSIYGGSLKYPRLIQMNNGYGGQIAFTYESFEYEDTHHYNYRVLYKDVSDGLGNTRRTEYLYEGPCFDVSTNWSQSCRRPSIFSPSIGVIGHENTTVNVYEDDSAASWIGGSKHYFHTETDVRQGREYQTMSYANAQGTVLRRVDTNWTNPPTIFWNGGSLGNATWTAVQQVETKDYSGGASTPVIARVTNDSYDTYGNLTSQTEYDENDTEYRQTIWGYYPNTNVWIVNKPGYQNVRSWEGASGWVLADSTWYAYDGHEEYDAQIGSKGELTAVRRRGSPAQYPNGHLVDTVYTYDGWGNRTSETTYDGYGDYDTFASAGPHITTITYDTC